jgi:hypothetical protein
VSSRLGHRVRLIPPQYLKPFVKRAKNDRNERFVYRRIDLIVDTWRSCHWATTPSRKGVGVSRELFGRRDVECVAAMVLEIGCLLIN